MKSIIVIFLFVLVSPVIGQDYTSWRKEQLEVGDTLMFDHVNYRKIGIYDNSNFKDTTIDRITRFLQYHSELKKVKIAYHTDCRGSASANLQLSKKRADYLIYDLKQHLKETKIDFISEGFGESRPRTNYIIDDESVVLDCDFIQSFIERDSDYYEFLHKENRRFELIILEVDSSKKNIYGSLEFSPFQLKKTYKCPQIIFEFDSWVLVQNDSVNSVDSIGLLADFLKQCPNMIAEISYHSDSRGRQEYYSRNITQRRAQSIVGCLIEKYGIPKNQLIAKGYGPTKPYQFYDETGDLITLSEEFIMLHKNKMTTEKYHQMNRRVELKLVGLIQTPNY